MNIYLLIEKFLKNNCTEQEISILSNFFKDKHIKELDKDFLIAWKSKNGDKSLKFKEEVIWSKLKEKIEENKSQILQKRTKTRIIYSILKYVAVFLGIVTTSFYVFNYNYSIEEGKKNKEYIKIELADGTTKKIIVETNIDTLISRGKKVAIQKGNSLIYSVKKDKKNKNSLVYDKLTVPYGKKFQVILSDGSLIYLNSGSSLKYPVNFIKGQKREVFLEGEAYFKIAKNKEDVFVVNANNISTKVYGTQFNISSYENEENVSVVLVEGSIGVSNSLINSKENKLKPNQIASYSKVNNNISIASIEVDSHIAWIDNVLLFKNEKFNIILKKLERHYGVEFTVNKKNFNNERFTGRFEIEPIEDVLNTMNKVLKFKYIKNNNQIIIN